MSPERNRTRVIVGLLAILLIAGLLGSLTYVAAQSNVATEGQFEIGDGVNPLVPGLGDIDGDGLQPGPDWDDLFGANGTPKDVYDEFGALGANGVPDFLDTFDGLRVRRDAAFLVDDISAGTAIDGSVAVGAGLVGQGTVEAIHDLGNAYAYTTFDRGNDLILYAGLERLAPGAGSIVFEFNRKRFAVDADGAIVGERSVGDLRVVADFPGGVLGAIQISKWEVVDAQAGAFDWSSVDTLPINAEDPAEQCNAAGTLCAVCNGSTVGGGDWTNYDSEGNVVTDLSADMFFEFGLNLSALLGVHTYDNYYGTRYANIQLTTYDDAVTPAPQDVALGSFIRASKLAR